MKSREIKGVGSIRLKVVINEYNYDNIRSRFIYTYTYISYTCNLHFSYEKLY